MIDEAGLLAIPSRTAALKCVCDVGENTHSPFAPHPPHSDKGIMRIINEVSLRLPGLLICSHLSGVHALPPPTGISPVITPTEKICNPKGVERDPAHHGL